MATPDDKKFAELLLYVASKCEQDRSYGAVKLNKILFYSDFLAYRKWGSAITHQEYRKLEHGPVPSKLPVIQQELIAQNALAIQERDYYGNKQKRPIALREARLDSFAAQEVALIDEVIQDLWGLSATEVSALSHAFDGWELADYKEVIPYSVIRVSTSELSASGKVIASSLVERARALSSNAQT